VVARDVAGIVQISGSSGGAVVESSISVGSVRVSATEIDDSMQELARVGRGILRLHDSTPATTSVGVVRPKWSQCSAWVFVSRAELRAELGVGVRGGAELGVGAAGRSARLAVSCRELGVGVGGPCGAGCGCS
jgi:hypothetical protein